MSTIPKKLSDFIGIHKGENIIVCGCGTSLLKFREYYPNYITIGVNDVPSLFTPTYLVVTDHQNRFYGDPRKKIINDSQVKYLFTCTRGWRHPRQVIFDLGTKDLKSLDNPDKIDHFMNSPYVAVGLAYKMGAKNIGLIGVDFTDGHFYNVKDGAHPIIRINYLNRVNDAYKKMKTELQNRGVGFYNLSEISKVEIPKITLPEFNKL